MIKPKSKFQKFCDESIYYLLGGIAVYFVIAMVVFGFRHPWMTDTERALNLHKALTFQKVKYSEIRD